ncbi:serine hydrolase [Sphingomonas profundi]|uniref:serine hydrolase n=1 Tax=Alterirhizorhabdus profundi TaxID=2681549 RepID=UPI0012E7F4D9|nr:serine hydrolase [Sphingomonas profundi]
MSASAISRRGLLAAGGGGLAAALAGIPAAAMPVGDFARFDPAYIDAEVERFRKAFEVPGYAVAIVGATPQPYLKGYGVRTLGRPDPVGPHTRFAIASNTKAYTTAALAILVDEGRLGLDDPVVRHLPAFRMHDPAITPLVTVRDLLCHRSGLPLGAGDLLFFPDTTHKAADALKALAYLKAERPFRSGYAYDNILYTVAGLLIAQVSGMPWRDFVTTRLLRPIGAADAVANLDLLTATDVAGRHGRRGGRLLGEGPMTVVQPQGERGDNVEAAGGINASVADQARWMLTQLARGVAPDGTRIWSAAQAEEMWTPQVIVGTSDGRTAANPARSVLRAYALGWGVSDYRGERLIGHAGGLNGQITRTALLPGRGLGVAVFSNAEGASPDGLRNAIIDHLIGAPAADWVAIQRATDADKRQTLLKTANASLDRPPAGGPSLPLQAYAGRYGDPWYGDVVVRRSGQGLAIAFVPTPDLKGALEPWGADTFRTRFPTGFEDALVRFAVSEGRVQRITMTPFSPLADFSYDYQHLDFRPAS